MDIIDTAQNIITFIFIPFIAIQMAPTNMTLNRDIGLELSPSILRAVKKNLKIKIVYQLSIGIL